MITFFSDLDNTLIYSHRYNITNEFRLIEVLNGQEQGYITKRTLNYFKQNAWLELIPVTTRTRKQYERLHFLKEDLKCEHSLVANGAILLIDGDIDPSWYKESLQLFSKGLPEIRRIKKWLEQEVDFHRIHEENPFFVYASSENPNDLYEKINNEANSEFVNIYIDRTKVYCMPKKMNKGYAITRYIKKYNVQKSISAGDSLFDYEMLERTNYAFVPRIISEYVTNQNKIEIENSEIISDEICEKFERLHKEGALDD